MCGRYYSKLSFKCIQHTKPRNREVLGERFDHENRPKARQTPSGPTLITLDVGHQITAVYNTCEIFRTAKAQAPPQADLIKSAH